MLYARNKWIQSSASLLGLPFASPRYPNLHFFNIFSIYDLIQHVKYCTLGSPRLISYGIARTDTIRFDIIIKSLSLHMQKTLYTLALVSCAAYADVTVNPTSDIADMASGTIWYNGEEATINVSGINTSSWLQQVDASRIGYTDVASADDIVNTQKLNLNLAANSSLTTTAGWSTTSSLTEMSITLGEGAALNFNSRVDLVSGTALSIDFGSVTSSAFRGMTINNLNFGSDGQGGSGTTAAFHATTTLDEVLAGVDATTKDLTITLINSNNNACWNSEKVAFNLLLEGLEMATDLGTLYHRNGAYYTARDTTIDLSQVSGPYYALVLENAYPALPNGGSGSGATAYKLLIHAPEPATATLSLLALAGLSARRRRH